jgi:Zn-dependent protease
MKITREVKDLVRAWFIISLAFAIFYVKYYLHGSLFGTEIIPVFLASAFTVGLGFILHELAHRYFARRYGAKAEFYANNTMLFMALIFSFFGFIFAAPGAVVIKGYLTKRKYGHIALAGPVMNILLGIIFLVIAVFIPETLPVTQPGMMINFWLALFNMLPFPIFDGFKVLKWNRIVYGLFLVISIFLAFGSGSLLALA